MITHASYDVKAGEGTDAPLDLMASCEVSKNCPWGQGPASVELDKETNPDLLSAAVNDFNVALQCILQIDENPKVDDVITDAAVGRLEYLTERVVKTPARSQCPSKIIPSLLNPL